MPMIYGRTTSARRRLCVKRGWSVACPCGKVHRLGKEAKKVWCECGLRLVIDGRK